MFRTKNVVFYNQQCVRTANTRLKEVCSLMKLLHRLSLGVICWQCGMYNCGSRKSWDHENKTATITGILSAARFEGDGIICQVFCDVPKSSRTEWKVQGTVKNCTYHHISGEACRENHTYFRISSTVRQHRQNAFTVQALVLGSLWEHKADWKACVPRTMFALCKVPHESTGLAPQE